MPRAALVGQGYTLSATMHRGLSTDNTANMKFGFFDATPSWDAGVAVDEGHAIAIAPRNNWQRRTSASMVLSTCPTSPWRMGTPITLTNIFSIGMISSSL